MNNVLISILLIVVGLIVGFALSFVYNSIKAKNTDKTVEKIIIWNFYFIHELWSL